MTPTEAQILAFEEATPVHTRTKEATIRERFKVSPARYYQIRNRLLKTPEGIAAHPALAARVSTGTRGLRSMFAAP